MKQKNIIIAGICLLVIIGIFIVGYVNQKPADTTQQNLYASTELTNDKLVFDNGPGPFNLSGIYETISAPTADTNSVVHKYYCEDTGEEAEKIIIFDNPAEDGFKGGWAHRFALVCENKYWIVNAADSFGKKIYGPYLTKIVCKENNPPATPGPTIYDTLEECDECVGYGYHGYCYGNVAVIKSDLSICELLTEDIEVNNCMKYFCEETKDDLKKYTCYFHLAFIKKDKDLCDKTSRKEQCISCIDDPNQGFSCPTEK